MNGYEIETVAIADAQTAAVRLPTYSELARMLSTAACDIEGLIVEAKKPGAQLHNEEATVRRIRRTLTALGLE